MAMFSGTIHMDEESSSTVQAYSKHHKTFETNWISIKIDRGELTIFTRDLHQMAVIAKQLTFAVDQAIRDRVNDYETEDIVEYTADVINIRGEAK